VAVVVALGGLVVAAAFLRSSPRPYVITAIDYHFHDAHPTFPIGPGRDLVIKNAGSNVHNVTISALDVSQDVAPGQELTIEDVADRLEPGRYQLVCLIHQDRGMTGTVIIVDG
jgi:plastocyanin